MPQKTSPFLEGKWGWNLGEDGWNSGADENWLKFSYMFDRNVDGIVSSLPPAVNGTAYFNTTDNRFYFVVDGTYYSSPCPKWFVFTVRSTGDTYQFNGITNVLLPNLTDLQANIDDLHGEDGANLIGYGDLTIYDDLDTRLNVRRYGAIGNGTYIPVSDWYTVGSSYYRGYASLAAVQIDYPHVTAASNSVDWVAIQQALNYAVLKPCVVNLSYGTYVISETLIWKGGAFLVGVPGRCTIKLMDNANCSIIESQDFDYWAAWTSGSNVGYTLDGGIDGILLDGNAQFQDTPPVDAATMQYGLRIHSHRFAVGWLQIRRMNGIGCLTRYNSALMFSFRVDGLDDYGLQGSPLGSPSPYDFRRINIIDCLYEHFVFQGPADIPIWHITTNYCGWLDNATTPTTPRTSLLFPGEEIHSVRIQTACKIGYANLNGALYGRSLYVAGFTRFHGDTIIVTGSWGAALIEGSAFGSIAALSIQQNAFAWEGVYKPGLEITPGTGSASNKNRFSFPQVSLRRLTTPVQPNAIGPGILDNSGAQFGIIDGIDSNAVAGHGLIIGASSRGGIYESVNFDSLQGTASDGTASAAILVQSGTRDWRINIIRLTSCDRGIVNNGANMRGIVRDGVIETNVGQIALEGIVADSQLTGVVIPGTGNISVDNISSWGLELLHNGSRYYNRFKTTVTFAGGTAGAQASATIPHTMWRKPDPRDIKTSIQFGGTTWPDINAGIRTVTSADFIAGAFVHTAATGAVTLSIEFG